jgi:peptidoglycan/xylan/chitin deacetylase (PgdA/CDA1 family)
MDGRKWTRRGFLALLVSCVLALAMNSAPAQEITKADLVWKISTDEKVIFITIDDGFSKNVKARDLLIERKIPVALFLTGTVWNSAKSRKFYQPLVDAGALIGNHTEHHPLLTRVSDAKARKEICAGRDSATAATGSSVTLMRPPGGAVDNGVRRAAARCDQTHVVMWNVTVNGARIATYGGPMRSGDIVLLHWRNDLHVSLEKVLREAKRLGLRPASLADYLN